MFRIGKLYPNLTSDFDMAKCPEFWRSNKIKIDLFNMKDEGYMDNIQISAYIAIGLDLLVGIGSFVIVWRFSKMRKVYEDSEDECGPWSLFGCNVGGKVIPGYSGGPNSTLRLFSLLSLPMSGMQGCVPDKFDVKENISGGPNSTLRLFSLLSLPMSGMRDGMPDKVDVKENISVGPGPFKLFRGFGRMKFILFKIVLAFGMPLVDTITGKGKLFL